MTYVSGNPVAKPGAPPGAPSSAPSAEEPFDRMLHAAEARLTSGLSPFAPGAMGELGAAGGLVGEMKHPGEIGAAERERGKPAGEPGLRGVQHPVERLFRGRG